MDFVKWQVYIEEEELNGFHRQDYFLAQIAHMIAMSNSKDPGKVKFDRFLLKFTKEKPQNKGKMSLDALKKKMMSSRLAWGALLDVELGLDDLMEVQKEEDVYPFQADETVSGW